jgi:hypothetical protein
MTTLCYYVTGHGYGHAVRSSQVIAAVPKDVRVIVRTVAPEHIFRSDAGRDFDYLPAEFDCGCLQQDSVHVKRRETLDLYARIAARNAESLGAEIAFLERERVDLVASDIPSFPLLAAREAGCPGFAVTNFTWHDIYSEYIETDSDRTLLRAVATEYRAATAGLITPLATPGTPALFERVVDIPIIARRGAKRPRELRERLGLPQNAPVAFLYFGIWGLELDWASLADLAPWVFLAREDAPGRPENVIPLDTLGWSYSDVAASVDAVVAKTGYGTVSQCIADGVPLVYIPREDFVEHPALVAGMEPWGGAVALSLEDFAAGRWRDALAEARSARIDFGVYAVNGADIAVKCMLGWI